MPPDLWVCSYVAAGNLINDMQANGVPPRTHGERHNELAKIIFKEVKKAHEVTMREDDESNDQVRGSEDSS